jgi:hypothetical protein
MPTVVRDPPVAQHTPDYAPLPQPAVCLKSRLTLVILMDVATCLQEIIVFFVSPEVSRAFLTLREARRCDPPAFSNH